MTQNDRSNTHPFSHFPRPLQSRESKVLKLLISVAVIFPLNAGATVLMKNGAQPNITYIVYTVPKGKTFTLQSAVFSADCTYSGLPSDGAAHHQRILKSGAPITADIAAPGGGGFQLTFTPPIVFTAGQTVAVQNGNTGSFSCTSNFLLQGQ